MTLFSRSTGTTGRPHLTDCGKQSRKAFAGRSTQDGNPVVFHMAAFCARKALFFRPGETPGAEAPCHPRENFSWRCKAWSWGPGLQKSNLLLGIVNFFEPGMIMRAVVQRVLRGSVTVDNEIVGQIGHGLVVLLGVGCGDTVEDAYYLADKISQLRIFDDQEGKLNLSVQDVGGSVLAISQFTLFGDCRKGRRPSYSEAARPEEARELYEVFVQRLVSNGLTTATGRFQEHMVVEIINDGPVTLLLDSRKQF
ncbi:D-tyrosyl-tRNA(Tyr) deacylase [Desulfotomaculum nigrificans CO-1-SRB]|uniref:D-aminoacyl-tRNA deacylase n=2 Tax=Desulfotomaculum nigrificans TaxID=1565 RepID=F6B2Z3_DESCC|nr:D-tyrosyl-tRNA(Tyr) deacylase [Desulfotomaculum nigrificans CO-1-SRB]